MVLTGTVYVSLVPQDCLVFFFMALGKLGLPWEVSNVSSAVERHKMVLAHTEELL
jgi:hypothetical protein